MIVYHYLVLFPFAIVSYISHSWNAGRLPQCYINSCIIFLAPGDKPLSDALSSNFRSILWWVGVGLWTELYNQHEYYQLNFNIFTIGFQVLIIVCTPWYTRPFSSQLSASSIVNSANILSQSSPWRGSRVIYRRTSAYSRWSRSRMDSSVTNITGTVISITCNFFLSLPLKREWSTHFWHVNWFLSLLES